MKKLREMIKKYFAAVDKWLLFFCISISTIGILCQYSLVNSDQAAILDIGNRVALVQVLASVMGISSSNQGVVTILGVPSSSAPAAHGTI